MSGKKRGEGADLIIIFCKAGQTRTIVHAILTAYDYYKRKNYH
jgi:hypothetical protein